MLKLLLDEHISPRVAQGLQRRHKSLIVHALSDWQSGEFLGQEDAACMKAAAQQGLTLVTYDRRTVPPLLKAWAEEGRDHGGVIFVDEKSISPADVGGLVRALEALVHEMGKLDWSNRVCFLKR